LYSALLLKKSLPDASITISERNRPDDTFGFGIVLSAETLANLKAADAPTHKTIGDNFAYWDDIDVQFKGEVLRSSGHGFSGIRRLTLLNILQNRAVELGIDIQYQTELDVQTTIEADLIIASDGMASVTRKRFESHFVPHVDVRSNRFVWLGAKMNLPGFYYSFRENSAGIWNMHAYQYTPGESTIVIETTNEAFLKSGLSIDDEAATAKYIEALFADDLKGASVLTNRSAWRQFPTYHCEKWHYQDTSNGRTQHTVLLGDAAHTAHFSIGSGTKLALEDAIALSKAIAESPTDLKAALGNYDKVRRDEVGRIQHSANVSLVWFENVRRFWAMHPIQFNVSLLTRSKQITFDNLAVRDPKLVLQATHWWNSVQAKNLGIALSDDPKKPDLFLSSPPMFAPFALRAMTLANRVVVSPMAQYSAQDGVPNDWHLVHYGSRAIGGAGLIFTEMTCPSPEARITEGCTGLWNKTQAKAWKRVVDFAHSRSRAKICLQLGHAGRKGSTQLGWETMDAPLSKGNWPLVSASPIPYKSAVNQKPKQMSAVQMKKVTKQFVASAKLAQSAGFDMLELHMAHGYLLASFLSPITNQRNDEYGGSLENRLRFPLALFTAVRKVWPVEKPISVRISATDWIDGGTTAEESVEIAKAFKAAGCDLIDVSTGQTAPDSKPIYGRMYQATFAEQIRLEAGIATMAVGAVTTADQINTLLISGRADLVALARPHLANPYFTLHASAEYQQKGVSWPVQYQSGAAQLFSTKKK
jgi:anthraniloyl-CoA monooxygenase